MSDVLALNIILPQWFFQTLASPLGGGLLTAIPVSGIVTLIVGVVLAIRRRERFALFALLPVGMAHLYVTAASFFRGGLPDSSFLSSAFLLGELLFVGALIVYSRHSRLAAALIGWSCLAYAFVAALIGDMTLTNAGL
jgi:hypothetical protein